MAALLLSACFGGPAAAGDGVLRDLINDVQIGTGSGQMQAAQNDTAVVVGSQVKTGENSLGRLAFGAGPSVRFSSNTNFGVEANTPPEEVRLRLMAGRLRLSLFGHRFGIVTPLGLVHLDGFGEVAYLVGSSPEAGDDELIFRCLSGPCEVQNDLADLTLLNMEAVSVMDGGLTVTRTALAELDLRQFMGDNPGSAGLIATLTAAPTSTGTAVPDTETPLPTETPKPTSTLRPPSSTPTRTATRTRAPTRVPVTRTGTASPPPAEDTSTHTPTPQGPNNPGPGATATHPPPTALPTATNTPVPPPTDTPLPPPPPTKTPEPPTDTPISLQDTAAPTDTPETP